MDNYRTYTAGLPCKNPSCKSHGKPHPFCKCYGTFAEGGEADFCSTNRPHNPNCEYFAGGGEVIDPDDVVPDAPNPRTADVDPDDVIPDEFHPDDVTPDGGDESNADMEPADLQEKMRAKANPDGAGGGSPLQQAGAAVEGIGRGLIGPLATGAELGLSKLGVPGLTAEDQDRRQQDYPITSGVAEGATLVGSQVLGVGEMGLLAKGFKAVPALAKLGDLGVLGKIGAGFIKNAITSGVIQGGDEASKWALGEGDPQDPVGAALSHTALSMLLGGSLGALGAAGSAGVKWGLNKLADSKIGEMAEYFLYGLAAAAKGETGAVDGLTSAASKGFKAGQKFLSSHLAAAIPPTLGASEMALRGYRKEGVYGAVKGAGEGFLGGLAADFLGPATAKIVAPAILKVMSSGNVSGILGAVDHAVSAARGSEIMDRLIDGTFNAAPIAGQRSLDAYFSDETQKKKDREKLDKVIERGHINDDIQQHIYDQNDSSAEGFAKGGEVTKKASPLVKDNDGVAMHYPDQNILLSAARGRVLNYLGSLRPQEHQSKLAYDDKPDNREATKSYHRALDIAARPLGVIKDIQNGTIDPEHIKHLNTMYPEVSGLLQKKITERITRDQLDGKKPSFKTRQGLSMFMGTALSGEFTPENIQAAQAVFSAAKQPPPPSQPAKPSQKSTSTLTKADQAYLSGTQAREQRAQRS